VKGTLKWQAKGTLKWQAKGTLKWQAADGAYEYEGTFNSENQFHATGSIKPIQEP
jgi:hypothetical protein